MFPVISSNSIFEAGIFQLNYTASNTNLILIWPYQHIDSKLWSPEFT